MSDALPLPPRPDLSHYKKLAKDFQRACRSGDSAAVRDRATRWVETLARLRGHESMPDLRGWIDNEVARLDRLWTRLMATREPAAICLLAQAQFFVARAHGFSSWPRFARHIEGLARELSPVSKFEAAVDAIVDGDAATLARLLAEDPKLVRTRSTREHRSTLLHYVSANGVEDFRQKTPHNIIEITKLLLKAGADVNAESDAYGGRSTTLGLTATSWHPEDAGVQLALLELLIEHGALIEDPKGGSTVNACLHNGRGEAAAFLAGRGARLDLEGAAGVGRLDIVKSHVRSDGTLKPPATRQQAEDGFGWACQFGLIEVAEFLLQSGVLDLQSQLGLHWAAYVANVEIVKLLLDRRAPVDLRDPTFNGTPLDWALYAWGNLTEGQAIRGDHHQVVARLVRAGAKLDARWYEDDQHRRTSFDPRMEAALRGEIPTT